MAVRKATVIGGVLPYFVNFFGRAQNGKVGCQKTLYANDAQAIFFEAAAAEAAAKQAEASHPESAAAPESGDRFDQLEQMVNHKKRTESQLAPAAKPIKPVVVETPAPRSRLKRILDFFKLRR